jgi:hypothetical protein
MPDRRSEEMNTSGYHEHTCQYNQVQITYRWVRAGVQVWYEKAYTYLNKKDIIFFSSQQHNRQQHRLRTG